MRQSSKQCGQPFLTAVGRGKKKKTNAEELWNLSTLTYNPKQDVLEGWFHSRRKYLLVIIAEAEEGHPVGECESVVFPKEVVV